jgi:hypothetical protein
MGDYLQNSGGGGVDCLQQNFRMTMIMGDNPQTAARFHPGDETHIYET